MINKLIVYQESSNFILTRKSEKEVFDAEEFLRMLNNSKERLEWLKRDIEIMQKLEPIAKIVRELEIKKGKEERDKLNDKKI